MTSHDQVLFAQFIIGALTLFSLGVVLYLARLKFSDMRKRHRMTLAGERFGLIQTVVGTGTVRTQPLPQARIASPSVTSSPVKSMDTQVKRWTLPASTDSAPFQWN